MPLQRENRNRYYRINWLGHAEAVLSSAGPRSNFIMMPTRNGSIRLFRFSGIDVFLHWSWFVVAVYEFNTRRHNYSFALWNALEYLALFGIVLMHEFGHSLACRSVGGKADQIVLWPLGGVAYVNPPPRPGATLWSIAAGPLVNVILLPILTILCFVGKHFGWPDNLPDTYTFLRTIWAINLVLLIFNMIPVYPLDGGQILRSLLWFWLGRAKSLLVASSLGFVGVLGFFLWALSRQDVWLIIISVFIFLNCWRGFQHARALSRLAALPRRAGFICPSCQAAPPIGEFWLCGQCQKPFDTFLNRAVCPNCSAQYEQTSCPDCRASHPISQWETVPPNA